MDATNTPKQALPAEPTNEFLWYVSGSSICEPAGTIAENLPKEIAELIVRTHNQEIEALSQRKRRLQSGQRGWLQEPAEGSMLIFNARKSDMDVVANSFIRMLRNLFALVCEVGHVHIVQAAERHVGRFGGLMSAAEYAK